MAVAIIIAQMVAPFLEFSKWTSNGSIGAHNVGYVFGPLEVSQLGEVCRRLHQARHMIQIPLFISSLKTLSLDQLSPLPCCGTIASHHGPERQRRDLFDSQQPVRREIRGSQARSGALCKYVYWGSQPDPAYLSIRLAHLFVYLAAPLSTCRLACLPCSFFDHRVLSYPANPPFYTHP